MRAKFTHRIVVLAAMLTIAVLSFASAGCRKKSNVELGLSLVQAVRDGSAGEVRDLLAAGASLNARDENGGQQPLLEQKLARTHRDEHEAKPTEHHPEDGTHDVIHGGSLSSPRCRGCWRAGRGGGATR